MLVAQNVLLHLTHCVARQAVQNDVAAGMLETGKVWLNHRCDICTGQAGITEHHGGDNTFPEIGMWNAKDCAFHYARHIIDHVLDFLGVNVVSAGDDQILLAAHNADPPIRRFHTQITGDEKTTVTQFLSGFFGHVPIALKDVVAAHLDHANFIGGNRYAIFGDFHLRSGERIADGPRDTFAIKGVGGDHIGFRHAVPLQYPLAGSLLKRGVCLGKQGCGA